MFQVAKVAAAVAVVALATDKVQKEYSARKVRSTCALHHLLIFRVWVIANIPVLWKFEFPKTPNCIKQYGIFGTFTCIHLRHLTLPILTH